MFKWSESQKVVMPITALCLITITFLCYFLFRKSKHKSIPLKTIAILLIVLEIIKQTKNIIDGFDPYILPLHYCSLFVFLFPLAQFAKGKTKDFFKPVAISCAIAVSCALYSAPSAIINVSCDNILQSFASFHTFVFHQSVVLYALLTIVLHDYIPKKNDYISITVVMICYGIIGVIASYLLDTNYCNFLRSALDFVEKRRVEYGQIHHICFTVFMIVFGTSFVSYTYYLIYNLCRKIKGTSK